MKNCSECGRLNNGDYCVAGGIHKTQINILANEHDIHIFDTKYQDNAITITRQEAKHLIDLLCKELNIATIEDIILNAPEDNWRNGESFADGFNKCNKMWKELVNKYK